jgi:hypothetical protein
MISTNRDQYYKTFVNVTYRSGMNKLVRLSVSNLLEKIKAGLKCFLESNTLAYQSIKCIKN